MNRRLDFSCSDEHSVHFYISHYDHFGEEQSNIFDLASKELTIFDLVSRELSIQSVGACASTCSIVRQIFLELSKRNLWWRTRTELLLCYSLDGRDYQSEEWKIVHRTILEGLRSDHPTAPYTYKVLSCRLCTRLLLGRPISEEREYSKLLALGDACAHNHLGAIPLLLEDITVIPSYCNDYALRRACVAGHTEVVKLLLQDNRIDPSSEQGKILNCACCNNKPEVVRLLLADKRVDPRANSSTCLEVACKQGHNPVVKLLLEDGRADPSVRSSSCLRAAIAGGHTDVVELLLADERVESSLC